MSQITSKEGKYHGTNVTANHKMRPVKFIETHDGLSLAWSRSGSGLPLVKAAAWLTHLEYDSESPVWSHWTEFFEGNFDFVRYDERGCGLSDRKTGALDLNSWTNDLERVVDASDIQKPFILMAMSQGTGAAVEYAAKHPESVSHLILCGGYARGVNHRNNSKAAELYSAATEVFRMGWDSPNSAFKEVMTKRFIPDSHPDALQWFNDLCQRTTSPEIGAELMRSRADMNAAHALEKITCPTMILHAEGDNVAPVDEARFLARNITNAELVMLPSNNHILQSDEPAWDIFCENVMRFVGNMTNKVADNLTPREREILTGICAAKSNKEIARDLGVSDKTVRNMLTNIFAKLEVSSRQEAILKARG